MKRTRLISVIMAMLLVLGAVLSFAACEKNVPADTTVPEASTSEPETEPVPQALELIKDGKVFRDGAPLDVID
ncbi:MAG: hypothetical protein MJ137_09370, partial [Clostridia bacterium]|nr:hypothetical protein [Clostridia bacterium]